MDIGPLAVPRLAISTPFSLSESADRPETIVDGEDSNLNGRLTEIFDMIERLNPCEKVGQVLVSYAFRFWGERNDWRRTNSQGNLRVYRERGGSFQALLLSIFYTKTWDRLSTKIIRLIQGAAVHRSSDQRVLPQHNLEVERYETS